MGSSGAEGLAMVVGLGASVWLLWRILARAGLPRWWAIPALAPPLHLILLWVIAFSRWPNEQEPAAGLVPAAETDRPGRTCPQCAAAYDPADYRDDVVTIRCSTCGASLPRYGAGRWSALRAGVSGRCGAP
jgi:hypothetical protein